MKLLAAALVTLMSLHAGAAASISCTDADKDQALNNYDNAVKGVQAGEATVLDVKVAKLRLQDILICNRGISTDAKKSTYVVNYCESKQEFVNDISARLARGEKTQLFTFTAEDLAASQTFAARYCN